MIGDYTIDRELSTVPGQACYEATHVVLPRRARITVARDRAAGIRVLREACILEALRHPGVPRMFDCGTLAGQFPWIATELVRGEALPATPTTTELAALTRDVAAILAHAHRRGVVHDGLWLDSIVRDPERGFPICLREWSRARCGDPAEGASDVRALGLAIYAAMPVHASTPLASLIDEMLAPAPHDRPTAAEVRDAADRIVELPMTGEYPAIEEVQLVVDLSRELPLPPPIAKPRWTPPLGSATPRSPTTQQGVAIGILKRG
jgi:hypothetical protein